VYSKRLYIFIPN